MFAPQFQVLRLVHLAHPALRDEAHDAVALGHDAVGGNVIFGLRTKAAAGWAGAVGRADITVLSSPPPTAVLDEGNTVGWSPLSGTTVRGGPPGSTVG